MAADIRLEDDSVTIEGSATITGSNLQVQGALGVGTATPQRPLHVETGEIHSGGGAGGFSFAARTAGGKNFFPQTLADRWLLYADVGTARLWTSGIGDVFSIRWNGQVFVGGGAAGYSFGDQGGTTQFVQDAKNGERWTWFAKEKMARLRSGVDLLTITLDGKLGVNLGVNAPQQQLHVEGGEVHSGGAGAGFSFSDRKVGKLVEAPAKGERWVWYADKKMARLWSGADKLTISAAGVLDVAGINVRGIMIGDGKVLASTGLSLTVPSSGAVPTLNVPEMIDLVATIVELRSAVAKLQQQVKMLGGKP